MSVVRTYRIRRHRRIGDRYEMAKRWNNDSRQVFEIVGILGNGHYQIRWVDVEGLNIPCGPVREANLGLWVEDTTTTRPYPFEGRHGRLHL